MGRIIVSGASGFLGSNIISRALDEGIEVVSITTRDGCLPGVTYINTDEFINSGYPFTSDDVFINCLFPTNADGYMMGEGLKKVYTVISAAHESSVGAFINISSQSVYSAKRTTPAKEDDPLCLESAYAVGKYSSEVFVNQIYKNHPHTNIRMASLLGVGYDQRIINRMVEQALKGNHLTVVGGMQRYCFLDVRDAAAGLVKLATSDSTKWEEAYILGRNESYTLIDVVECIVEQLKKQAGMETRYIVTDGEDYRNSSVDASRFMKQFEWAPEVSLSQTTADIINSKHSKVGL